MLWFALLSEQVSVNDGADYLLISNKRNPTTELLQTTFSQFWIDLTNRIDELLRANIPA